ncbi:glycosyltransferase family protein [Nonlabens ponticola]|uniref:Glycosyltransferase n=1 Tax=Nonlabens ponticola TaxID=2496866 RepID=A0A3S9MZL0_9FLAO|nr:glycosyltransferase family 4 protein [Nonlabens ponticola]AZQ44695.1 hypothetical protein EJ995_10755 [Nonlabens ponticola]
MRQKKIVFPLLREVKTIPPTISLIEYLGKKGYEVVFFTYYSSGSAFDNSIKTITVSNDPYPSDLISRILAKIKFNWLFFNYYRKNKENIHSLWFGALDVIGMHFFYKNVIKVYQAHELEERSVKNAGKFDYVIVPEENRAWILYFLGKMQRKPLLLPNIPNYNSYTFTQDEELLEFKKEGKVLVLYSGLIDIQKRNLFALLGAIELLPPAYCLVIIPSTVRVRDDFSLFKLEIEKRALSNRVFILESRTPPFHLDTIGTVDIGIGLYSATSLNNVYAAPNRLYEFTMMGTPVILPDYPGFKAFAKEFPYAINTVDANREKDMADTITSIYQNIDLAQRMCSKFCQLNADYDKYASVVVNSIMDHRE